MEVPTGLLVGLADLSISTTTFEVYVRSACSLGYKTCRLCGLWARDMKRRPLELEVSQCVFVAFGELASVDGRSPCLCFWSSWENTRLPIVNYNINCKLP
jgi:hypothetical protein